ncbi:hypothetical protein [Pseudomonas viridiflava]|nr:hypothetical protein [Pseudomonas viridiflava]
MTAQVRIVLGTARNAITVPVAALGSRTSEGSSFVRVVDAKGFAQERKVQVGINNNVQAEIKDGLVEGDQVVIGDPTAVVAGA